MILLSSIIGFIGGFGSGMFGIGGGSIRIPLLNLAGFTLISSYGLNMLALPITCFIGAFTQRQNIDFRIGGYMVLGGSVGTVLGTLIAFSLATSSVWLAVIFVMVSLVAVIAMNLNHLGSTTLNELEPSPLLLTAGTLASNTLTGMRGGSEGSLFVPLLRVLNVDMHKAIATALFAAVFTSIVGVFLYWAQGHLVWDQGLAVIVGSVIGARLGSYRSIKTKSRSLEIGLSVVIVILAMVTLLKAFVG